MSITPWSPSIRPHVGQAKMIAKALIHQIVIWAVGRRYGKTRGGELVIYIEGGRCAGRVYKAAYCSPTYRRAREVYADFIQLFKPLIARKRETDLYVEMKPFGLNKGAKIWFWSLEQHDNLRGEGLDRVIIDECADVVQAAYDATLMPMLADTNGKALLLGTPKRVGTGFVWFHQEFTKGEDADAYPTHYSGHGPSEENPHISQEALKMLRENCLDEQTRREEYDAEWVTEEGAVFERLDEAFCIEPIRTEGQYVWIGEEHSPEDKYIAGLDLGRFHDYTVLTIFNMRTRNQAAVLRIRAEEYVYQMQLIHGLRKQYDDPIIIVDEHGAGTPLLEMMRREFGDHCLGRKWNNRTKEEDITRGRLLFQDAKWRFINTKWQKGEFSVFTREHLEKSGTWRYSAPSGMHDDAVAAACLTTERLSLPFIAGRERPEEKGVYTLASLDRLEKRERWRDHFKKVFGR